MLRHPSKTVLWFAIVGITVLVGGACGAPAPSASPRTASEPPIGTAPLVLDSVGLQLPVQDYMLSTAELEEVAGARMNLVIACMGRFGIEIPVSDTTSSDLYGPKSLTDRRYGITDAASASQYGFGLGPRDPALQGKPDQPDLDSVGRTALTGQGQAVVGGKSVPEGGCLAEAERELGKGVPAGADSNLPQRVQFQSFEMSKRDSRVAEIFVEWSHCMAAAGYRYSSPLQSAADPRFTDSSVSQEEESVAAADVACKEKTNLVGVWFTVESAYQRDAIRSDLAAVELARSALKQQLANARSVLGDAR
jgi:hypothetical protein